MAAKQIKTATKNRSTGLFQMEGMAAGTHSVRELEERRLQGMMGGSLATVYARREDLPSRHARTIDRRLGARTIDRTIDRTIVRLFFADKFTYACAQNLYRWEKWSPPG